MADYEKIVKGQPSAEDLMGRQSVRATFKLSPACINALSIVSAHLGIKKKSLFDLLVEDTDFLQQVGMKIGGRKAGRGERIQKTYVISRKTLTSLDTVAKRFKAPRDALVEFCARRLLPLINSERQRLVVRREIKKEIDWFLEQGRALYAKTVRRLGENDPVSAKIHESLKAIESLKNLSDEMTARGKMIEEFEKLSTGWE